MTTKQYLPSFEILWAYKGKRREGGSAKINMYVSLEVGASSLNNSDPVITGRRTAPIIFYHVLNNQETVLPLK